MDLTLVTLEVRSLHGEELGGRVRCACGWSHGEYGGTTAWVLADVVRLVAEHPHEGHPLVWGGGAPEGGAPLTAEATCNHGYRVASGRHLATGGVCDGHEVIDYRADRSQNRGESAKNRGELIDGAE